MVVNYSSCVVVVAASVVVSVEELQLRIFLVILPNFLLMSPCLSWVHCQALDIILENLTKFQLILIGPTERGWSWKEYKSWCDLHGLIKNFVKKSQLTGAAACYFKLVSLRIRTRVWILFEKICHPEGEGRKLSSLKHEINHLHRLA